MSNSDKLRPAEEVWEEMIRESAEEIADRENACSGCCGPYGTDTWLDYEVEVRADFEKIGKAYAAVIDADRAQCLAAKDAQIARLCNAIKLQMEEKHKEAAEAKLWFGKAQEWKQDLSALQAHADALVEYGGHTSTCDIMTHGVWSDPVPCTCGWWATFRAYEAFKAASHD